jgi:hypothetical protein
MLRLVDEVAWFEEILAMVGIVEVDLLMGKSIAYENHPSYMAWRFT